MESSFAFRPAAPGSRLRRERVWDKLLRVSVRGHDPWWSEHDDQEAWMGEAVTSKVTSLAA